MIHVGRIRGLFGLGRNRELHVLWRALIRSADDDFYGYSLGVPTFSGSS